jgi:hypothetical protein
MAASPAFAFTINYEPDSVEAAAHTLCIMQQRRTLRLSLGSLAFCFLTIGAISWYLHFFWMLWFPFGLLVLDILLRLYTRWAIRRRLQRTLANRSAQIELSDAAFSIATENGSHVLPWRNFKSTRRDAKNLFLVLPETWGYRASGKHGIKGRL